MANVKVRILDGQIEDSLSRSLIREPSGVEQRSIQATLARLRSRKNEQPGKLTGDRSQTLEGGMRVEEQAYRSVVGR
jgi:hypothetical protein